MMESTSPVVSVVEARAEDVIRLNEFLRAPTVMNFLRGRRDHVKMEFVSFV